MTNLNHIKKMAINEITKKYKEDKISYAQYDTMIFIIEMTEDNLMILEILESNDILDYV